MTRTKCEFEEIAAFLLDPRTNPAGSGNHFYLFKYWETHVELLRWLFERNIIFKAVELGLVDVDDLKKIVFWAHETNPTIFSDKTDRTGFCNGLLEAVERSRVLKLQDFGEQFLEKWLRRTRGSEFQTSTPQLLWRICRNSISDDGLLLRNTLSTSISMIDRSSIHLLPSLVDFMLAKPHQLINKSIFMYTWMLRQRLSIIPPSDETGSEVRSNASFRKALLARTSAEFGRIAASTAMSENVAYFKSTPATVADVELDREPSRIELWYAILAGLGTARSNQFTLCQSSFMEWVDHGKTEPDERSRLLVGLWTVMALSARDDSALVRFKDIPLGQVILERFSAECEQRGEDILASIVTNLQRSRLFAKNKFLHRLETFSDGLINVRSSYRTLDIQLASLKERELSKLSDKLFYSSARHHFPHLLRSVAESVNKDLAQFEQLGCNIIRDVQGSINLVLRLLFHNQKLKFALSRAASGMAEDTADSLQMNRAAPTDTALGGYTYAQLVAMIDNFAIECATTTTISDRNAFRKVYWLHMYLQMHCAPITPRMRRALWHAVAMRPQKPTYRLVKYVCDLVADYEGWHAAQQLLCAAARESREKVLGNAVKARRLERSRLAAAGLQVDTMHQVNTMHQGEGHNLLNMDLEEDIASDDDYGESHEADGVKVANGEPNSPVARDVNEIQTRITERSPEYENATVYVPFTENNQEG
ncbi:hypothetical protein PMZ80_001032 [Knufia obscura]|nr:hypothetical protein PMZ80_001032 [Knufia obscura]